MHPSVLQGPSRAMAYTDIHVRRLRQFVFHETAIPFDELHHAAFVLDGIRTWFISRRGDADLITFYDGTVLVVRRRPRPQSDGSDRNRHPQQHPCGQATWS